MTKSSGFRLVAVAVSAALAASSASAICKDKERPHTIGYVSAWGSTTELHLEWTAGVFPKHVFQENEYYDIAVRMDSPGGEIVALYNGVGPLIADATGQVSATIPGLQPGTGYCFAVRGRTESGTEGCSGVFPAKWNCHATRKEVTQEDAAAAAFCRDYADQAGAEGRESQQLQCGDAGPRWSPDVPMHLDWCMGLGGDQTLPNSERDARTAGLAACRQRIAAMREVVQKPSGVGAATMAPRDVGIVQQRTGVAGLNEVMQPPSGSIGGVQIPGGKGGQREIPGLPAPDVGPGYALVCHGGGGMVTTEYNQMVSIIFVRAAHGSAKAAPGPGECAWVDRAVGANEPQTLVYLGGGTIAQELLQRAKKPGLFQVHAANNNAGALTVVSLD